jgi:hypothetical protein
MFENVLNEYGFHFDTLYGLTSNKSKKLKYSNKAIEKLCNDPNLINISAKKSWDTGWESDYCIYLSLQKNASVITFAEEKFELSYEKMKEILLTFSDILKSPYSIGFFMPYNKSPDFYTCGIGCSNANDPILKLGTPEYEAKLRFSRWGSVGMPEKVYLRGVIREVYPMNLLCRPQAFFSFHGKPFFECVRSGMIGGTIEEITPERFLWTVSESAIPSVTEQCDKAGFLFNQLKDVPGNTLWDDPDVAEYHKGDVQREANGKIIQKFVEAAKNNSEIPDPSELYKIFEQKK